MTSVLGDLLADFLINRNYYKIIPQKQTKYKRKSPVSMNQ